MRTLVTEIDKPRISGIGNIILAYCTNLLGANTRDFLIWGTIDY